MKKIEIFFCKEIKTPKATHNLKIKRPNNGDEVKNSMKTNLDEVSLPLAFD